MYATAFCCGFESHLDKSDGSSSYDVAAATVPRARAAARHGRSHRREVRVHLYVRQVVPQLPYGVPADHLAVVELDELQVVAGDQVLQRPISHQRAVVQP